MKATTSVVLHIHNSILAADQTFTQEQSQNTSFEVEVVYLLRTFIYL